MPLGTVKSQTARVPSIDYARSLRSKILCGKKCVEVHRDQGELGCVRTWRLEPKEAAEVERHLASCPGCRDKLREFQKVNCALVAAPPSVYPPSYLKDGILARRVLGCGRNSPAALGLLRAVVRLWREAHKCRLLHQRGPRRDQSIAQCPT